MSQIESNSLAIGLTERMVRWGTHTFILFPCLERVNEKLRLLLVLIEKKPVGRQIDVGARPLLAVLHHRFLGARSRKEGEVKATPKKIGKIGPKRVFLCFLASSEKEASKAKVFTHYSRISFPGGSSVKRAKFVEAILFFLFLLRPPKRKMQMLCCHLSSLPF